MKPSQVVLALMSVAVLSSCHDKSKSDVKPNQPTSQNGEHPAPTPTPAPCPACGMG